MSAHQSSLHKLFHRGAMLAQAGKHAEAETVFRQVVAAAPDNEHAWLYLAGVAANAEDAEAALQRVQMLNPNNPLLPQAWAWAAEKWGFSPPQPIDTGVPSPALPIPTTKTSAPPRRPSTLLGIFAFLGQKLGFGVAVLLSIIYLSFLGLDMARGASFGSALVVSFTKTIGYLARLARGDLGFTQAGVFTGLPSPVIEVIPELLAKSFGLLAVSLTLAAIVGITLGLLAAYQRRTGWSLTIIVLSIVGVSIPSFFAALLLQLLLIQWTRKTGSPLLPLGGFGWDKHLILPALVLAARPVAQITRVTFLSIQTILKQDFVRVAHAKGLRGSTVLWRHVVRNAAIPVLTTIGLSLRFSLSSLPVVEFFFGWTGLGFVLLKAISQKDDNLTVALTLSLGVVFILVNIFLEAMYRLIDPRLRDAVRHVRHGGSRAGLKTMLADLPTILADNPISRWLKNRKSTAAADPIKAVLAQQKRHTDHAANEPDGAEAERRRTLLRGTVGNFPFAVGGVLVLILLAVVIFGPLISPHSPYTTVGLTITDGKMEVPPFNPGAKYPWGTDVMGRDIMSLVLAGAQQTLMLATLVMLTRVLIGAVLGALAGWFAGTWFDRTVLSLAEIIAAFPTLLLAMILILAIGIRQGMQPFIIALGFVGWGEVMQFVRGEVMALRPKPFIESAVAVGLRTPGILRNHVLPNLVSPLISIASLEMGAVLMLLGELGFIGIFIGGGAFAELQIDMPPYHYSDVPEWGALLSNVRVYARAYPWTAIYPTLAFFISILSFNLFGEGVRRLVENVGVGINRLFNRYTMGFAALAIVAVIWARSNTGSVAFYRQQAEQFSGQNALAYVQALSDPALDGRALGTDGIKTAADYIAAQFEALGLQPAGEKNTFTFRRKRGFEQLTAVPQFSIDDGGSPPVYHQNYTAYPGQNRNLGEATGTVRFITTGPLRAVGFGRGSIPALKDIAHPDDILMVLSPRDAFYMERVPRAGLLVIADDETVLQQNHTLSNRDPVDSAFGTGRKTGQDAPVLWIDTATANRLLAGTGQTVENLRLYSQRLLDDQLVDFETPHTATISVQGELVDRFESYHVLGYLPGTEGQGLDGEMIMVLAQYDAPPLDPDGQPRLNANNNASGVAVMLEAIRTMQESGYQPYRTFMFVAYSSEGLEGGEVVSAPPDPQKLLQAKIGFGNNFSVKAVVDLRGLGAGDSNRLAISTGGSQRLGELLEKSARQMGVKTVRADEPVDFTRVFAERSARESGQEAPQIMLHWEGWEKTALTPADTPDKISVDTLQKSGRALALSLMILGRETEY